MIGKNRYIPVEERPRLVTGTWIRDLVFTEILVFYIYSTYSTSSGFRYSGISIIMLLKEGELWIHKKLDDL